MMTNTINVDIENTEKYSLDTQKTPLYVKPVYPNVEELIKKSVIVKPNSTSIKDEENLEVSHTTLSLFEFGVNRFEVLECLFGYIDSVDKDTLSFTITAKDDSGNIFDMYLSYLDVEKNDIDKIRIGALLVVLFGYEYINGTARKRTKIVFRAVNKWNSRKIDIYKNGFKSE